MGRPDPCVLFAQTFVHPQLDEYVDEVIFAEPVVITACEFLEQNTSSASSAVTLLGGTSPPSFALEVFVQCEGEARFRRLCQPFLHSHLSSNLLEVEAVVTTHLVVRGSYRSLSLVIYGNTEEDLGQFNMEFDLDSSLANTVTSTEEKLEDLLPLFRSKNLTLEDSVSTVKALSAPLPPLDISVEIRKLLQLIFKMLELRDIGDLTLDVMTTITSASASFFMNDIATTGIYLQQFNMGAFTNNEKPHYVFIEARQNLLGLCEKFTEAGHIPAEFLLECTFLECEADLATSKQLVDMLFQHFQISKDGPCIGHPHLSQNKNVILWLSLALILCSGREGCFHFVNGGGMEQLQCLLSSEVHNYTATTLMLLGVIEQATRYSVGCEGLLGWWSREDENVPSRVSEGYSQLLKLLIHKQRHDVASLATYILHRLRLYEVSARYECAVLSILGGLSVVSKDSNLTVNKLANAKLQLKKVLKLLNSSGPIEDPSPVATVVRSLIPGLSEGKLSYKATSKLIASSDCQFIRHDIDAKLLSLLKERGFLPLSLALISSSKLRKEVGCALEVFVNLISSIEAIMFSLLFCRTGLVFLLHHPELSSTAIHALKGPDNVDREQCIPLRYASVLISNGFFCRPQEVGMNVEMHLRVVSAIDRLLTSTPRSEEFLWILWELCALSRSYCGRQALLALVHFPEAIRVLIEAMHSTKEMEIMSLNNGTPVSLAVFHSAAEIFEVIVTDLTSSSLAAWIEHAMDLHKSLHSSSPGSNRKDAPTRLLEWIDAGVVYLKNGATGLLRYAAILASGGDAHITSTNILVSDSMDVENVVGGSDGLDANVVENRLGKLISEKSFDGVALRDSSVAQLTTAIRILALISENSEVVAALYDEGAMTVIYVVLVNCRLMLERSSNNYDYLVDDGIECNPTSDLLLERSRETCLVDLLIPSLQLLSELLQKLETKEQYRNSKLMKVLLGLHRELSPRLAACTVDLSSPYPDSVLGLGTACHFIASALAFWPAHAWAPGLFHTLLDSVHASSSLALGPKETCSMLCLLNDLFPQEIVWDWKNGIPLLASVRLLAVPTLLGSHKERQVNWYLDPPCVELILSQMTPHLGKIAQLVLHYAVSTLVVIQDMIRVFIIRLAYQKAEFAFALVRPILSWIQNRQSEPSLSETDVFKVYRLLDFLSSLLEHPLAKPLLLKEGTIQMLIEVLQRMDADAKSFPDGRSSSQCGFQMSNCCLPVLLSLSLIFDSRSVVQHPEAYDRDDKFTTQDCSMILAHLFKLCQVLPVGRELLACLATFKELVSRAEGQNALLEIFANMNSSRIHEGPPERLPDNQVYQLNNVELKKHPLLHCWINIYRSIEKDITLTYAIEALNALCIGALRFCIKGRSLNKDRVVALKYLFGLPTAADETDSIFEENIMYIQGMSALLGSKISEAEYLGTSHGKDTKHQVVESVKSLSSLLQTPMDLIKSDGIISPGNNLLSSDVPISSKIHILTDASYRKAENDLNMGEFGDKFQWECPENLRNRLSEAGLLGKRRMSALDGPSRQGRGENSPVDVQSVHPRGSGPSITPGPTRRDTFRQRKPNTSRPPSMHVDDYVARERNADVSANSNVIAVPRLGSSGGRPPSIHVDEFMARQRERQNVAMAGGEAVSQAKSIVSDNETDKEKPNSFKQLKVDLDDDLQGLDIVFDAEESEPDDRLPFPQPDDNLQQAVSVGVGQSPQRSIVEEIKSDTKDLRVPASSNVDEHAQSELSSKMSMSHPEIPLTREPSVNSDKKYFEKPDENKNPGSVPSISGFDTAVAANSSGFPSVYNRASTLPPDPRTSKPNFYPENDAQRGRNAPKHLPGQPPLPPTPPPPTISPVRSQAPDFGPAPSSPFVNPNIDLQPPLPPTYHAQTDYQSTFSSISTPLASTNFMSESRYPRMPHSSPGGSARPLPPLPPTPPPFSAPPMSVPSRSPVSQSSPFGDVSQYAPPPVMPPSIFNRPTSAPFSFHGNLTNPHLSDNLPTVPQNFPAQPSMPSLQPLTHLQPLQPPQIPFPPQPPQQPRPPIPGSQQPEQGSTFLQAPVQMQIQPQQALQQPPMSPYPFYQTQPQENLSQPRQELQVPPQPADAAPQQQTDSAMSLQQYFSTPEAIQSLLSDRDKLCQLLEQHPKLMQMLQERLGQL